MKTPRTAKDFRFLELTSRAGHSIEAIKALFTSKTEWRSEIRTIDGLLYCPTCIQFITLRECLNCGQTIAEGGFCE